MNYVDSTVSSPDAIESASGLSTVGVISMAPTRGRVTSLLSTEPRGRWIEDYRRLRTRFLLAKSRTTLNSVLVVSEGAGDGKSFTAANLAIALAMAGDSVILVDANLRNPHLHEIFGVPNEQGLASLLFDQNGHGIMPLVELDIENLSLLPAGVPSANPADLLSSSKMLRMIQRLRSQADFVIFDSPAMSRYADASILAAEVDAAVLVIESRKTRTQDLTFAAQRLKQSGATVLGVVLNKSRERRYGEHPLQLRETAPVADRPGELRTELLPKRRQELPARHLPRRKA
jgi:non-specific protein-tyrosine kinase